VKWPRQLDSVTANPHLPPTPGHGSEVRTVCNGDLATAQTLAVLPADEQEVLAATGMPAASALESGRISLARSLTCLL